MKTHRLFGWSFIALCVPVLLTASLSYAASTEIEPFLDSDGLAEVRAKIQHNGYSFTVAPNWVFNMSPEEKERFFSRRPSAFPSMLKGADEIGPLRQYLRSTPTESYFSWTDFEGHTYIGPVANQGNCGSCYAFGACAAAEGTYNYAMGLYDDDCADFSEAFVAFCLGRLEPYSSHFGGCYGADYDYYELEALVNEGVCDESDFPYVDYDPGECTHWEDPRTVFDAWYRVPCGDIDAIKAAIRYYGIVDAAVEATSAFQAYDEGVYEDSSTDCPEGAYTATNHAIALVGWDDDPPEGGGGCWILRNSWSPSWGEDGYMRIRYHAARVACAVCYLVHSATPPAPPTATTAAASEVQSDSATLNGAVNPNGAETTYHFEYGTSTAYGQTTTPESAGAGRETLEVSSGITDLLPFQRYHYRTVADSALGTTEGGDRTFMTPPENPVEPEAVTESPDRVACTAAVLQGSMTAYGFPTTCYFEYGPDTSYGSVVVPKDEQGDDVVDSGMEPLSVSAYVSGLVPGATCHCRLVAQNDGGTGYGPDVEFAANSQPAGRFFEEFEHGGDMPPGWTQEYVTGTLDWTFEDGDGEYDRPEQAYSGSYNALLFDAGYGLRTKLISPPINLGTTTHAALSFWLHMDEWWGDQDELRVYYKTSDSGTWTWLVTLDSAVDEWTRQGVSLPSPSATYYIAFEGAANWGYGVCIDDVLVTGYAFTFTQLPQGGWFEEGWPLELAVDVAGAVGDVTFQWIKDGAPIPDETSSLYYVDALTPIDEGWYSCRVTDESKGVAETDPVYVRVYAEGSLPAAALAGLAALCGLIGLAGVVAARRRYR